MRPAAGAAFRLSAVTTRPVTDPSVASPTPFACGDLLLRYGAVDKRLDPSEPERSAVIA
jgi:hypothetical protein